MTICVWAGLKGARSVHLFQSGSDGRSLVPLQNYINIVFPHKSVISAVFESLSVVFSVNKLTRDHVVSSKTVSRTMECKIETAQK